MRMTIRDISTHCLLLDNEIEEPPFCLCRMISYHFREEEPGEEAGTGRESDSCRGDAHETPGNKLSLKLGKGHHLT